MHPNESIEASQIETSAMRVTLAISIDPAASDVQADALYRGEVYGPLADDRTTLPASFRVPDFQPGEEARAIVTDPCFWSPDAPLEYEIAIRPTNSQGPTLLRRIRLIPRRELHG